MLPLSALLECKAELLGCGQATLSLHLPLSGNLVIYYKVNSRKLEHAYRNNLCWCSLFIWLGLEDGHVETLWLLPQLLVGGTSFKIPEQQP